MGVFAGCATKNSGMQSQVDELMRPYSADVPGASVLVLRDGKPLVKRAYGLAELEGHLAATAATNYRLASLTKQFTAASVLLLVEAMSVMTSVSDAEEGLDDSTCRVNGRARCAAPASQDSREQYR
jgi:Beta-lactamase